MSNVLRFGPWMVMERMKRGEDEQTYVLESEHLALAARLAEAERLLRDWLKWWGDDADVRDPVPDTEAFLKAADTTKGGQ